jgi:hypothetical protein
MDDRSVPAAQRNTVAWRSSDRRPHETIHQGQRPASMALPSRPRIESLHAPALSPFFSFCFNSIISLGSAAPQHGDGLRHGTGLELPRVSTSDPHGSLSLPPCIQHKYGGPPGDSQCAFCAVVTHKAGRCLLFLALSMPQTRSRENEASDTMQGAIAGLPCAHQR